MLIANEIIGAAFEISKTGALDSSGNPVGMVFAAQRHLNAILSDLCMERDLSAARGLYTFTLTPTQTSTLNGITNFGGPYPFPMDYLRATGSSGSDGTQTGFWYIYTTGNQQSQPYPLLPWDLGRYDMLAQLPNQSLPSRYATDISPEQTQNDRIVLRTTATITLGSTALTLPSAAPSSLIAGMGVAGQGIAQGTTVASVNGTAVVLSLAATATFSGTPASVFFGIQPNAYIWPGASGNFPAFLRYQRRMPNITDFSRVPWFEGDGYLIMELASRLCQTSGDDRTIKLHTAAEERMSQYLKLKDDLTDRAQTVQLDMNRFNPGGPNRNWNSLPNTKGIGWT
jgi:hypothetical protein